MKAIWRLLKQRCWLLQSLRPWSWQLGLSGLIFAAQMILTLALLPLAAQLEPVLTHSQPAGLARLLALVCLVYTARHGLEYLQKCLLEWLAGRWLLQERARAVAAIFERSGSRQQPPEQLLTLLTEDLQLLRQALVALLYRFIPSALTLLVLLVAAALIAWPLTLMLLLSLPVVNSCLQRLGRHLRQQARQQQTQLDHVMGELQDSLQQRRLIQLYGMASWRLQRLQVAQQKWFVAFCRTLLWREAERPLMGTLQVLLVALLLWISAWLVQQNGLQLHHLLAFAAALALAIDPALWLAESRAQLQVAWASWERLQRLLLIEIGASLSPRPSCQGEGLQVLDGAVYWGDTCILHSLNLCYLPGAGQRWLLQGASGAGKSTLLQVLAGHLPLSQGQIFWPTAWKEQLYPVVLVPQRAGFFNLSLRENLCLGRPYTEAQLQAVLEICQLWDVLSQWPEGLDTGLGPSAQRLSGGEQQRLAIARALLLEPELLLLDESLSELDAETSEQLFAALTRERPALSLILVSHREGCLPSWHGVWQVKKGYVSIEEAQK